MNLLMGIPLTGKEMAVTGIDIDRIEGGRIAESWNEFNQMDMDVARHSDFPPILLSPAFPLPLRQQIVRRRSLAF
jgi:hypothetical protein